MIQKVQAVNVMYHGRKVGTLSMGNRSNCQFEYDKDWLTNGFSLSPLKLPLKAGLFTADYQPFNGNFGVFEDSLPGGYGEYLLRWQFRNGSALNSSSVEWRSMYMHIIWTTTPVISALSVVKASGLSRQPTT